MTDIVVQAGHGKRRAVGLGGGMGEEGWGRNVGSGKWEVGGGG